MVPGCARGRKPQVVFNNLIIYLVDEPFFHNAMMVHYFLPLLTRVENGPAGHYDRPTLSAVLHTSLEDFRT